MPALTAADVTVAVNRRDISRTGRTRVVTGTITFGDGALTYPTSGVPLPSIGKFGFKKKLQTLTIVGVNELTSDYQVRFGPANNTLLLYEEEAAAAGGPLLECDTSEAPAARTYTFLARGF